MNKKASIIVDLGYGDAGKGSLVDAIARRGNVHTVVRYNGGAQAGHNVVTPDGRHHTFSQFGSASFVPGVRTHIGSRMIVHPFAMQAEEDHLRSVGVHDAYNRLTIDERALVITPFQQAANRLRESARGDGRHGSCGLGVGETAWDGEVHPDDVLRAGDLSDIAVIRRKIAFHYAYKRDHIAELIERMIGVSVAEREVEVMLRPDIDAIVERLYAFGRTVSVVGADEVRAMLARPGDVVFEGAQGVLLDEWYGFFPYCTRSTITPQYAREMLADAEWEGDVETIGMVRAYQTRHGAGPLVTEDHELAEAIPDAHNGMNDWQQSFRIGWLDLVATSYAIAACDGVDALAVMSLDRLKDVPVWKTAYAYGLDGHYVPALTLPCARDLEAQEELTKSLHCVEPYYHETSAGDFAGRVEEHLNQIETHTSVPIRIIGFGATADDKVFLTDGNPVPAA